MICGLLVVAAAVCCKVAEGIWTNSSGSSGEMYDDLSDTQEGKVSLQPPHIILILADDLGYNDVGYHNKHVLTPVIDQLARTGVILENFYSMATCTPSRAALLTGIHPTRTGMHQRVLRLDMKAGLPLELELLPEYLKRFGYETHAVGKWHLGHYKKEYLPHHRGFDTFFGSLSGGLDSYKHVTCEKRVCRYDWRLNDDILFNESGVFGTHSLTHRAKHIIQSHSKYKPLFLYLPYHAPHGPLMVPKKYLRLYDRFPEKLRSRRIHGAMMSCLDEGIGNITDALKDSGLYNNSIIIFMSDNGGQVLMGGNNYPLRGWKNSLSEGGVRVPAFVHSPLIPVKRRGKIAKSLVHITDWMPTILRLAGVKGSLRKLDGVNVWNTVLHDDPARSELLINLLGTKKFRHRKPFDISQKAALRFRDWKIITGKEEVSMIWVPPTRVGTKRWKPFNVTCMFLKTNTFCTSRGLTKASSFCVRLRKWCHRYGPTNLKKPREQSLMLYNLRKDPEERFDLSHKYPRKVQRLLKRLKKHHKRTVKPLKAQSISLKQLEGNFIGPFSEVSM